MISSAAVIVLLSSAGVLGFAPAAHQQSVRSSQLSMSGKPAKGAGFNYDPSNYKDSNSGNYRRLSDQLAAAKFEDEELKREREEIIRKEQMANMILRKENETFWQTPGETVIATADKYFVSPAVLQVIDDLDNQLIGLKPVSLSVLEAKPCHLVNSCNRTQKQIRRELSIMCPDSYYSSALLTSGQGEDEKICRSNAFTQDQRVSIRVECICNSGLQAQK